MKLKSTKITEKHIPKSILFFTCTLLCMAFLFVYPAVAQSGTSRIVGKTIDSLSSEPLPGVSVFLNGRAVIASDGNGVFKVQAKPGDNISFSLIGYLNKNIIIGTIRDSITVSLQPIHADMGDVVVTALGIRREEKSLGYALTSVSGEELTEAASNNWTDALSGKVAGLNLVKSGAGPAGTNQIILRGETSLTGGNDALIVIDGVVLGGGVVSTGTGSGNYQSADAPVDFGNALADLSADDIESVSILKGPGASALYGYRGANGAIIITTKSGKPIHKGLGISVNSNLSLGTINRWPEYQNEYGQGVRGGDLYYSYGRSEDGPSTLSTSSAWGPKFDGQLYYQYNPEYYRVTPPERTLWRAYENNRKEFFQNDFTAKNSISISGGNSITSARLSYTNTYNSWIIPNTGFNRNAISLQLNHKIGEKLILSSRMNYTLKKSDNLPNTGYNNQTYMYFIRGVVPNWNPAWFKPYWRPGEEGIVQTTPFSNLLDNPYTIAYEMLNSQNRNNFVGNVQATYNFTDNFNLMVRAGIDFAFDKRLQRRPFDTYRYAYGYYRETGVMTQESSADFLFSYMSKKGKTKNFQYGASAGGSITNNKYDRSDLFTQKLVYPNVYNFANTAEDLTYNPYRSQYAVHSLYGLLNASYKEWLFADASARIDWASTLAQPLQSSVDPFFYPSVNLSFIASQAFNLPKAINFWKLRASVASVGGGGTIPYRTSYTYNVVDNFSPGLTNPATIPNLHLKNEGKRSFELGTDLRMFKSRLQLDLTVYKSNTFDQILEVPIDPASGYRYQIVNAGNVENKGLEMSLSGTAVKNKKFTWRPYMNFTAFDTKIISLADSVQSIVLSTVFGSRGTVEARVGGRYGDMYGFGYMRNENGDILYKNGLPLTSNELIYLGNANPTKKFGFGNEFKYKDFKFNVLIDGQYGGVGYSLTHAVLMEEGKLKKSLPGRYNGIIGNGVVKNADGTYSPNTVVADAGDYYYAHFNRDQLEANVFSTDFIKIREVRLDYTFPLKTAAKLKMNSLVVGLYGRDLFVFSNWPAFDPEFASLNSSGIEKGAEIAQFPSTRIFGINITATF